MRWSFVVVGIALAAATSLPAQRVDATQLAVQQQPVHRDTTRPSPDAMFVRRAVQASVTSLGAMVPFAVAAVVREGRVSQDFLFAGSITYLAAATYGASIARSRDCGRGTRLWRAFGGALVGATGGVLAGLMADQPEYQDPNYGPAARHRLSVSGFVLGVPVGAAAALYSCR